MNEDILTTREQDTEEHWISISDMMAGLMVIFLFIAISYMLHAKRETDKIKAIAVAYIQLQLDLYNELKAEFKDDLKKWNADLDDETLSIRFKEPEVLFEPGSAEVRPLFKKILDDFFPRYIGILRDPKYMEDINDIAEIRIEGHTSSEWTENTSPEAAYIHNMKLSQGRTRSVLEYVLQIPSIRQSQEIRDWLKSHLTANGLSSSKLITSKDKEIKEESRRVEFRVRTKSEERIANIIEEIKKE